ncbi:MAG: hypothetical protein IPK07_30200 [Deltaproteobacteria bacterium]|nr:hypothetical protein [Deltaproteobacteria bacterium]
MSLRELEPNWTWLFDGAVTRHVKRSYSPRESWRGRPFTRQDGAFQIKAIRELSMRLTIERKSAMGRPQARGYLEHGRFRAAYLLYFLPLQAAKFAALFEEHPGAIDAALADGERRGAMVVTDLGAGPGTASLALLLVLAQRAERGAALPPIVFHWFDEERRILHDGREIAAAFIERIPAFRGRVRIDLHVESFGEAARAVPEPWSLALLGHALNEGPNPPLGVWRRLLERCERGGGLLVVEPASKGNSQTLSEIRDQLFTGHVIPREPTAIWGPCLHAAGCPLAEGRDWCHTSVRATIPGEWFTFFSRGLGSERNWLKYSYLWLAAAGDPAPEPSPFVRRVLSDPIHQSGGAAELLLCEPNQVVRTSATSNRKIGRGDLYRLGATGVVPPAAAKKPAGTASSRSDGGSTSSRPPSPRSDGGSILRRRPHAASTSGPEVPKGAEPVTRSRRKPPGPRPPKRR